MEEKKDYNVKKNDLEREKFIYDALTKKKEINKK